MSQSIEYGRVMFCINTSNNTIEISRYGRNWTRCYSSPHYGTFDDLCRATIGDMLIANYDFRKEMDNFK